MLEQFTYDGLQLKISSPEARKFAGLFEFDSLSLLIGVNGSGKTQLLIRAAETLAHGALYGDRGNYSFVDGGGRDTKWAPEAYGMVYFTSLPYRRPLRIGDCLLDASRKAKSNMPAGAINVLRRLADELGLNPVLTGSVRYADNLVSELLVDYLAYADIPLRDQQLEQMRRALPLRSSPNIRSRELSDSATNHERRVDFSAQLVKYTDERLAQFDFLLRFTTMAALEMVLERAVDRDAELRYFLAELGLIDPLPMDAGAPRYVQCRSKTLEYLRLAKNMRETSKSRTHILEFEFDERIIYRDAQLQGTAIHLKWNDLSSGLLALVEQFAALRRAIGTLHRRGYKRILLLIDEGDAYLHLDWQREYIQLLNTFLGDQKRLHTLDSLQVVIASHSPLLAADVPACMVQRLDKNDSVTPLEKTFGAQLEDIVYECFRSNSVGAFAAQVIRSIDGRMGQRQLTPLDRALIDEIGDPAIRHAILRKDLSNGD